MGFTDRNHGGENVAIIDNNNERIVTNVKAAVLE